MTNPGSSGLCQQYEKRPFRANPGSNFIFKRNRISRVVGLISWREMKRVPSDKQLIFRRINFYNLLTLFRDKLVFREAGSTIFHRPCATPLFTERRALREFSLPYRLNLQTEPSRGAKGRFRAKLANFYTTKKSPKISSLQYLLFFEELSQEIFFF